MHGIRVHTLNRIHFRSLNKRAVLKLIRYTTGGISRAEVARRLNLSRSAVSTIVNDLLENKVIREGRSGPAKRGRRPILLEINPDNGFVVGVDAGATHLALFLCDLTARVLAEIELPMMIEMGPVACLEQLDEALDQLLARHGVSRERVRAAGVAVPGPVNQENGMVIAPPIMPGWDRYPIRSTLQSRWEIPVVLGNDAEFGALGEWALGAGRGEKFLIYLKVGTGVGAGLVIDGQVYHGACGTAGEIGHITVAEGGPRCSCGNRGCLEAVAGGGAIARLALQAVRSGQRTRLADIHPVEGIAAQDVAEAARMGDRVAQEIVAQCGKSLGTAIASLVNLFNPSLVVIGGGVAQMGDLLLEPIRETVAARSLKAAADSVRISGSVLGRRATGMGAVVQALDVALTQLSGLTSVSAYQKEVSTKRESPFTQAV